jgi:uncharacterized membrane protein
MTAQWPPTCGPTDSSHPLAPVVSATVTAGTLLVAFSLLALGVDSFWLVFVVGFGGVLPLSRGLLEARDRPGGTDTTEEETALETLRLRYARGELTHEEFEQRVEELVETEPASGPSPPHVTVEQPSDRRKHQ